MLSKKYFAYKKACNQVKRQKPELDMSKSYEYIIRCNLEFGTTLIVIASQKQINLKDVISTYSVMFDIRSNLLGMEEGHY